MKRLVSYDVLQRLSHHDAFHRVKSNGLKESDIAGSYPQQFRGRVAEIPGQPIHARIRMTGRASSLPQAGVAARVVKMAPAGFDHARARVEQRQVGYDPFGVRVHYREDRGETAQ